MGQALSSLNQIEHDNLWTLRLKAGFQAERREMACPRMKERLGSPRYRICGKSVLESLTYSK